MNHRKIVAVYDNLEEAVLARDSLQKDANKATFHIEDHEVVQKFKIGDAVSLIENADLNGIVLEVVNFIKGNRSLVVNFQGKMTTILAKDLKRVEEE